MKNNLNELIMHFDGEIYNLCYKIINESKQLEDDFQYLCENLLKLPQEKSIEIDTYLTEEEYMFIRNSTRFFASLNYCKQELENWFSLVKEKKKANIPAIILAVLLLVSVSVLIFSFSENSKLREENAFHLDTIKDKESKIGLLERSVDAKAKEIGDLKEQTYADAKEKSILSEKVEYSV